jgi:glycosyltransferase involved in cell wall biosynthesis
MIARYDPMKDHATFISAAKKLSASFPDVCFILVGRGVTEANSEIMQRIQRNGLESQTMLLGEREDIPHLLQAFDINTLCSKGEGFPNVIGEAMASGIPCVATDTGDAAHVMGNTGRVIPIGDSHALVRAWTDLLALPPEKRSDLGLAARKRVQENFSISQVTETYEKLYRGLLSNV